MLDLFGPSLVITSLGYRVLVLAGFALWRPQVLVVAAAILGATFVFRLLVVFRLARSVRKILAWGVGADATVVSVPRKGDVMVQVDGRVFPALEVSRNPNRPKVGQHVGVLMNRSRSDVLMFVG